MNRNKNLLYAQQSEFEKCCNRGNLIRAKQIWEESNHKINIRSKFYYPFRTSCLSGHLNIVKWLWEISRGRIDIYAEPELFDDCFDSGYLELIKWLFEITNGRFYSEYQHAFEVCCTFNHLHLAKWIYSIKNKQIDIFINNNFIFRQACKNKYTKLINWLIEISNWLIEPSDQIFNRYEYKLRPSKKISLVDIYISHHYYKIYDGPGYLNAIKKN